MAEIRIVTCGRTAVYLPNGASLDYDIIKLYHYKDKEGSVIFTDCNGNQKTLVISAENEALKKAVADIEALAANDPDYPCDKRPFFNEVYMQDGSYRFVPREELRSILDTLHKAAFKEELTPDNSGKVSTAPKEVEYIRISSEYIDHRLKRSGDEVTLTTIENRMQRTLYTFDTSHPAFEKAESRIAELDTSKPDSSGGIHEIQFSDGSTFIADSEVLLDIVAELTYGLDTDPDGVTRDFFTPLNTMPTLQGAVAYFPEKELQNAAKMGIGVMGVGNMGIDPAKLKAPQPEKNKHFTRLNEDGSWDCACGAKGLTSKFCYSCGAAKPQVWKCSCGCENISKFCQSCGKPKPQG